MSQEAIRVMCFWLEAVVFNFIMFQFMDGFSVDPIPGSFLERIGERRHRQLADSLERQLNGGSSFLQAFSL
ncbi:T3SS effector NleG [Escherichia coli]|nr:T3SS effector NleG [Escherichia coli]